jgi:DNA-binding IclR family transcriptional regulator
MSTKFRLIRPTTRAEIASRFAPTPEEHAEASARKLVWQHAVEEFEESETRKRARAVEASAPLTTTAAASAINGMMPEADALARVTAERDALKRELAQHRENIYNSMDVFCQGLRAAGVDNKTLKDQFIASGLARNIAKQ